MAAVTICSDFGTQGHKICHCFHCFPICLSRSDGTRCHDLSLTGLFFKNDLIYEQDYFNTLPNSFLTQTLFAPGHSPCDKQIYFSNAQEILSHTACCNDHPHFSLHSSCLQLYLLITSRISILPRFFFFLQLNLPQDHCSITFHSLVLLRKWVLTFYKPVEIPLHTVTSVPFPIPQNVNCLLFFKRTLSI